MASVVTSAPAASPNSAAIAATHRAEVGRRGSSVGVPPPKKTVVDREVAVAEHAGGPGGPRAIAASAYVAREAPGRGVPPSSSAV